LTEAKSECFSAEEDSKREARSWDEAGLTVCGAELVRSAATGENADRPTTWLEEEGGDARLETEMDGLAAAAACVLGRLTCESRDVAREEVLEDEFSGTRLRCSGDNCVDGDDGMKVGNSTADETR
jgi:hypothetical protein